MQEPLRVHNLTDVPLSKVAQSHGYTGPTPLIVGRFIVPPGEFVEIPPDQQAFVQRAIEMYVRQEVLSKDGVPPQYAVQKARADQAIKSRSQMKREATQKAAALNAAAAAAGVPPKTRSKRSNRT
jgi:hypothetical protein